MKSFNYYHTDNIRQVFQIVKTESNNYYLLLNDKLIREYKSYNKARNALFTYFKG